MNVRFGSQIGIAAATRDVGCMHNSDQKSVQPRKVMSAVHPKADICGAAAHVRYGPKADIAPPEFIERSNGFGYLLTLRAAIAFSTCSLMADILKLAPPC